jgi:hypothetical protein
MEYTSHEIDFVTQIDNLSSFLLIFELFSLIFHWKYSIFLHETPHTWCKLVTDQWRGSLGVSDSESCWFTEEIGTYMRCWESPGDLPLVIEILFLFAVLAKRHKISNLSSFLLIFELFSLIFHWKYSIFLHETPHTWNMTCHISWRHWRMVSKVRVKTSARALVFTRCDIQSERL